MDVFGTKNGISFWEYRFLPHWFPLIIGGVLGVMVAVLISQQAWHYLIPLTLIIPAVIIFNKYPFVAIILWLLFTQFYVNTAGPAGRFIFWILHRGMIPAALIIVIVSDWFGVRKKEPVKFGRAELAILIFILFVLASIFLLHPAPTRAIIKFYDRLIVPFCMYLLVRLLNPDEKDLRRILPVLFFILIVQSVIGLMQWYAPQLLPPQWLRGNAGSRTVGTFGNPAVYTTTLLFTILMLLQFTFNSKSRWRGLIFLAVGLGIISIFFSFSRGSWLGGLIVLTGVIILYPRKMLPLAIIQFVIVAMLSSTLFAAQIAHSLERLNSEDTANGRIVQNYASFRMIQLKPWFGWGWDNYDRYARQFQTRVGDSIANVNNYQTSHNTYLSMITELGAMTFLVYIFPFFWWLWLSFKIRHKLPKTGFWSWPLVIMLWLLLLHHNIVSTFIDMIRFNEYGTTIFWLVLGLIANIVHQHLNSHDGTPYKLRS